MDWLKDSMWLVWLGGALVAGLLELASLDFVLAMIAGGALIASAGAALGASLTVQVLIFAGSSAALLVAVRPAIKRWVVHTTPLSATNVAALENQTALVLTDVTATTGTVKLKGETWTARVADPGTLVPAGVSVTVVRIDGATALVRASKPETPVDTL